MKSNFSSVFLGFFQTFKTSSKSTYVTSIPIQASLLDLIGCSCGKGENTMTNEMCGVDWIKEERGW